MFKKKEVKIYLVKGVVFGLIGLMGGWFGLGIWEGEASFNGNSNGYAWSEQGGWISFNTTDTYGVEVTDTQLNGYAWGENIGYISMRNDAEGYGVSVVLDGAEAKLSGFAWSEQFGYIKFAADGSSYENTSSENYGVLIDGISGNFSGMAWSENLGWINFSGTCQSGSSDACQDGTYGVNTSWRADLGSGLPGEADGILDSDIFDTESSQTMYNSLLWQGTIPTGASVRLQLATSSSSIGPWEFVGPDGTDQTFYNPAGPGISLGIASVNHLNHRYFRYRVLLWANDSLESPTVTDVVVNYSR